MTTYQPKLLKRTQFGNPILHKLAKPVSPAVIGSSEIKQLVADIKFTMESQRYGVGLAAPQIGVSKALSVILIRPTPARPDREHFESVIINPNYTGIGKKEPMWEGCLSFASKNSPVFAQAMRFTQIKVSYLDEMGKAHNKILKDLPAHVFQHETDHLNGILFPERVEDHKSWMNTSEYRKRVVKKAKTSPKLSDTID